MERSSSSPLGSSTSRLRDHQETEFNLREWGLKARNISRENTNSRRFSASYIRSFREDARSFRSNITISSTASSPGYSLRVSADEIDPSTYSFTTALQALQARAAYNCWECLSPDGFALNSKWNEAEKYICNPLSGEFPMECLSAKTLSGRSFRNLTNRITMSAPLIYNSNNHSIINNSQSRHIQTRPSSNTPQHDMLIHDFPNIPGKKMEAMTRDVGTQSTPPPELSSSSPSPASTPPIIERSLNRCGVEVGDSPNSIPKLVFEEQVKVNETREEEEEEEETRREEEKTKGKDDKQKHRHGGCLSWLRKRHKEKHKPRKSNFFNPINLHKGYC